MTPDSLAYPPRCLSRELAARYVGLGTTLFDKLVAEGRLPKSLKISDGRVVWDRLALDLFVDGLRVNDREQSDFQTYVQNRGKKSRQL